MVFKQMHLIYFINNIIIFIIALLILFFFMPIFEFKSPADISFQENKVVLKLNVKIQKNKSYFLNRDSQKEWIINNNHGTELTLSDNSLFLINTDLMKIYNKDIKIYYLMNRSLISYAFYKK